MLYQVPHKKAQATIVVHQNCYSKSANNLIV